MARMRIIRFEQLEQRALLTSGPFSLSNTAATVVQAASLSNGASEPAVANALLPATAVQSSQNIVPLANVAASYVIITTAAIQTGSAELTTFVANQQARGFTVAVETESAWGGGAGDTAADNIRNWLKANYASMGIQYVLLIGNPDPTAGDVPMKMTWPLGAGNAPAPTDYYFAELTSNWDANSNGYCGEWMSDFTSVPMPEVTVGRIPVYSGDYATLDSILAKTIAYENSSNTAWRKSMLLPMAISNYYDENGSPQARTDGSSLGEYIKNDLATPGGYSSYTMYEKAGVLPVQTSCNAPLTEANLVSQWSTNAYGIVAWWSHGDTSNADRYIWTADSNGNKIPDGSELSYAPMFNTSDVASLNDNFPSIVIQVTCDNGDPQYSSNLGYALLKHGAVATFCATAFTWYANGSWYPGQASTYGDDASYAYYITKQLTSTPLAASTGQALQWCRTNFGTGWIDGKSWTNVLAMNLYGDPSLYLVPPATVRGSVVNDVNGNGTWDGGEAGLSGQTVFIDDNNDGKLDGGTSTLASGNVNLPIPDGLGSVASTQTLSGIGGTIANVTVTLNISHPSDSDLTARLISPTGTQILLFSGVGGSGHNFTNTVLSDAGTKSITSGSAPFTGTFSPAQPLSVLNGQSPNGTWQLVVADTVYGQSGTLSNWTLTIGTTERSATTDANGNYAISDLTAGTYHVRFVPATGWRNTNPASGEQDVTLSAGQTAAAANFLTVHPVLTSIAVAPSGGLSANGTQQFTATGLDQFGVALASQPALTWSLNGVGSINSSGVLTPPYTTGSTTVIAGSGSVTGDDTVALPGPARWNAAANSSWNGTNCWTNAASGSAVAAPGLRGVVGDTVLFDTAAGSTASLDGQSPNLAGITFNGASYTIDQGAGGSLHLANGTSNATITVARGNPVISAPLVLDSSVLINMAAGSTLTIANNVNGTSSFTVSGQGVVVLRGTNSYAGETTISSGTLRVVSPTALPNGANLTIGASNVWHGASHLLNSRLSSGSSLSSASMAWRSILRD